MERHDKGEGRGLILNIFVPTYHRPQKLKRCLCSIVENVEKTSRIWRKIWIHISNNDAEDKETKEIGESFSARYEYMFYHENEKDIGIDANHEMVYRYCRGDFALLVADDDIILPYGLEKMQSFCEKHDFLFAVCNSNNVQDGRINQNSLYHLRKYTYTPLEAIKFFVFSKPGDLLPLLPYFGGVLINLNYMKKYSSHELREVFSGTYHQYIGGLWNALLMSKEKHMCMIPDDIIGVGFDDDKTWFAYKDDVMNSAKFFYQKLELPRHIREDLELYFRYCNTRMRHFIAPYVRLKSLLWRAVRL